VASVEAPLGKVEVMIGSICEEAWVAADLETVVEIEVGEPTRAERRRGS
jgi:hypothetical protein